MNFRLRKFRFRRNLNWRGRAPSPQFGFKIIKDDVPEILISVLHQRQEYLMSKLNHCKSQIGLVDNLRSGLATILGILLLVVLAAQIPMAFAGETSQEYHERIDREWYRQQEFQRELDQIRDSPPAMLYHAIAYSKSTSKWGYGFGKDTRAIAEQEAMRQCGEPDAEVLCWAKGSWYCALADGPHSYGGASAETPEEAKINALKIGNNIAPGCRIVLLIGGNPATVWRSK
jgi:hypothetical protein